MADFGEVINKFLAILASLFQALGPDEAFTNIRSVDRSFESFGDFLPTISTTTPGFLDTQRYPVQFNREVCRSDVCQNYALFSISWLQRDADPCEDFYQFACGGGILNNGSLQAADDIIENRITSRIEEILTSNVPTSSLSATKAQMIYSSCLDSDAIEQAGSAGLLGLLDQLIGGWPLTSPNWNASTFSLYESLRRMKIAGFDGIFRWNITSSSTGTHIINLGQPVLGMNFPDYYVQDETGAPFRLAYRNLIGETAALLTGSNSTDGYFLDIREFVEFERNLAGNLFPLPASNVSRNTMTFRNFVRSYSQSSTLGQEIQPLFQRIFREVQLERWINSSTLINVENPEFYQKLGAQLQTLDRLGDDGKKVLANYLGWNIILTQLPLLSAEYRNVSQQFLNAIGEPAKTVEVSRKSECVDLVRSTMPLAIASMYADKYISNDSKLKLTNMTGGIRKAAENFINNTSGLDSLSDTRISQRIAGLVDVFGDPDLLLENTTRLDTFYQEITASNIHFDNVQSLLRFNSLQSLRKLANRNPEQNVDPLSTSIKFYYDTNTIVIPVGVFQFPLFDPTTPDYVNYAGLGYRYTEALIALLSETNFTQSNGMEFPASQFESFSNVSILPENSALRIVIDAYNNRPNETDLTLPRFDQMSQEMQLLLAFAQNYCVKDASTENNSEQTLLESNRIKINMLLSNLNPPSMSFNCSPNQSNSDASVL